MHFHINNPAAVQCSVCMQTLWCPRAILTTGLAMSKYSAAGCATRDLMAEATDALSPDDLDDDDDDDEVAVEDEPSRILS